MPPARRRPRPAPRRSSPRGAAPGDDAWGGWAPAEPPAVGVVAGEVRDSALLTQDDVDALVLPLGRAADGEEGAQPRAGAADAAVRYGIDLADLAERLGVTGKAGESGTAHLPRLVGAAATSDLPWHDLPRRLVLVGVGTGDARDHRRAGAAVARATRGLGRVVTTVGARTDVDAARAFVEGYLLGAYRHPSRSSADPGPGPAAELVLLGDVADDVVAAARLTARATWLARTLTVTPSSTKNPPWLADRAADLARAAGLEVDVLDDQDLARDGFGGVLAVGAGSATPPRLVVLRHRPPGARHHVALVGKGITYDTGGISIKPRESMVAMKTDMAGAAVALAVALAAGERGLPVAVTAVLPLAENAVGASSYRPSDVLRTYGGTTVEVTNTDAEGRLVLADALQYVAEHVRPDVVVDVATLTGAATLGLGRQHAALFTADDDLAADLTAAGAATGEGVWRMPLVADYGPTLDSDVADVRHVPSDPSVGGGSVTAALFLQRFAGPGRWAHLDIAGPARAASAAHEVPEGATGFGARLLLRWLEDLADA